MICESTLIAHDYDKYKGQAYVYRTDGGTNLLNFRILIGNGISRLMSEIRDRYIKEAICMHYEGMLKGIVSYERMGEVDINSQNQTSNPEVYYDLVVGEAKHNGTKCSSTIKEGSR